MIWDALHSDKSTTFPSRIKCVFASRIKCVFPSRIKCVFPSRIKCVFRKAFIIVLSRNILKFLLFILLHPSFPPPPNVCQMKSIRFKMLDVELYLQELHVRNLEGLSYRLRYKLSLKSPRLKIQLKLFYMRY